MGRRFADLLLFGVTAVELALLWFLTPAFTVTDWNYLSQHVIVLGIALTRPSPRAKDYSLRSGAAVLVAYAYPYAQMIYINWIPGKPAWPMAGLVLVTAGACWSLVSLLTLGRMFGVRPALRGLVTSGPYALVRHPIYLSYVVEDIAYNLQEWNAGTVLIVVVGWASLIYRIHAEERILALDAGWPKYVSSVHYRLLPGHW